MAGLGEPLTEILRRHACLVGLGSEALGDDAAGMCLARRCRAAAGAGLTVVLAGVHPERHLAFLTDSAFDHVLFLDAVAFGGEPGSAVLLDSHEMESRFPQVSTHRLSLGLLATWIEQQGHTRVHLLGVQPGSLRPGADLSAPVAASIELLEGLLVHTSDRSDRSERSVRSTSCLLPC